MTISVNSRRAIDAFLETLKNSRIQRDFPNLPFYNDMAIESVPDPLGVIKMCKMIVNLFEEHGFKIQIWQAYEMWGALSEISVGDPWMELMPEQIPFAMDRICTTLIFKNLYEPIIAVK